jgi:hypothetical protein
MARALCRGREKMEEWIKRTDFTILCGNCHAELHDKLWMADEMKPVNDRFGTMAYLPKDENDAMWTDAFLAAVPDSHWVHIRCHSEKSFTLEEKQNVAFAALLKMSRIPIGI